MIFDKFGFLNSEIDHVGNPGRVGDACANTFRWLHLTRYLGAGNYAMQDHVASLYSLVKTEKGYLRHPESIWRELDFSGDQAKPLLMGLDSWGLEIEAKEVSDFHWLRYGNGDLVHPTFKAIASRTKNKSSWFWDISIYLQVVGMVKVPYRWNDEYWKQRKWPFEKSKGSTADWLNWVHMIIHAEEKGHTFWTRKAKSFVTEQFVFEKIQAYFSSEPNSFWLTSLYAKAISATYQNQG